MNNNDTRLHRLDTVKENAKFLLECYGKETAIQIVNDNLNSEQGNPISENYWNAVLIEVNNV
jgi:hypothetical protein